MVSLYVTESISVSLIADSALRRFISVALPYVTNKARCKHRLDIAD
jgi:hypothetical protein